MALSQQRPEAPESLMDLDQLNLLTPEQRRASAPHPAPEPESIAFLRKASRPQPGSWTLAMYQQLLAHLLAITPREETEQALGVETDDLLDAIIALGVWLGQSKGGSKHRALPVSEVTGRLFWDEQPREGVVLPEGYEPKAVRRRDVRRSLANIVEHRPDEETLRRFVIRRDHFVVSVLTYGDVASTHVMVAHGHLQTLHKAAFASDQHFAPERGRMMVEAYDLLDIARADGAACIAELAAMAYAEELDLSRIKSLIVRSRWMAEGDLAGIKVALESYGNLGDAGKLRKELRFLDKKLASGLAYLQPVMIGELNDGQVFRLVQSMGLPTEETSHNLEDTVRAWIDEAGLTGDSDQLYAAGIQAWRAELEEEFKVALRKRAAGDFEWATELNAALLDCGRARR